VEVFNPASTREYGNKRTHKKLPHTGPIETNKTVKLKTCMVAAQYQDENEPTLVADALQDQILHLKIAN
jgi:hypothetical protein